jgi:nucleoside-diphosphate-sugar epimerase
MWGWIDHVLAAHGLPPVQKAIPTPLGYGLASVMEVVANTLSLVGVQIKPLLTRFLVSEMSTHHYFNIAAAKRDFGYHPTCSIAHAMERTFGERKEVA